MKRFNPYPTAFGWVDPDISTALEWDRAQVQRLARHLGYLIVWPPPSLLPLTDQVRAARAEVVITPTTQHLTPLTLNALLGVADVETLAPRLSFTKWSQISAIGGLG
ncbi:hypothetical protein [Nocardia wallacei]|uniref:Uncharacterized protein n=1 Tax=Nocardia wallacei TaxID=480035 RepID=A0A7G1KV46_9NOCA|nr:hypothetical protein [Nocardia wallacei]BCK58426.1 hypothetical protein NWFMUON74_61980 [Nocardia wallacei]